MGDEAQEHRLDVVQLAQGADVTQHGHAPGDAPIMADDGRGACLECLPVLAGQLDHRGGLLQVRQQPGEFRQVDHIGGPPPNDLIRPHVEIRLGCRVDQHHPPGVVDNDHAVRRAAQDGLQLAPALLRLGKQAGVLHGDGGLLRQGGEERHLGFLDHVLAVEGQPQHTMKSVVAAQRQRDERADVSLHVRRVEGAAHPPELADHRGALALGEVEKLAVERGHRHTGGACEEGAQRAVVVLDQGNARAGGHRHVEGRANDALYGTVALRAGGHSLGDLQQFFLLGKALAQPDAHLLEHTPQPSDLVLPLVDL